jgi:hypothetical protein
MPLLDWLRYRKERRKKIEESFERNLTALDHKNEELDNLRSKLKKIQVEVDKSRASLVSYHDGQEDLGG